MNIGVIGTAGRDKTRAKHINRDFYLRMYGRVVTRLEDLAPVSDRTLVSGGAALADHLAVTAFHSGQCQNLVLHLPAPFVSGRFVDSGYKSPGGVANYYHRLFSEAVGFDSLASLDKALRASGCTHTVSEGFHARNLLVGQVDVLLALTWGTGSPASGGTRHTWDSSKARKIHVDLQSLL
jgi:hypothetical protein